MKLNPIKESDYFYILKNKKTGMQVLFHINGEEIMPIEKNFSDDVVEFYKTGCYVKVDRSSADFSYNDKYERCYDHIFFDNNGRKLFELSEVDESDFDSSLNINCHGHFNIEIEQDGVNIIYLKNDDDMKQQRKFSYTELRGCLGINEEEFFDSINVSVKSND